MRKALFVVIALLAAAVPCTASATQVTACRSDNQMGSGSNLSQAIALGGDIYIRCPGGSVIAMTRTYSLHNDTQIIGDNTDNSSTPIIMDGTGVNGPLLFGSHRLTLQHLAFRNFPLAKLKRSVYLLTLPGFNIPRIDIEAAHASAFDTPTLVKTSGDVELDNVRIDNCPNAIVATGSLTIKNSAIVNSAGTAVVSTGNAQISGTTFERDERALLISLGKVANSIFSGNTVAAIDVLLPSGPVAIQDSSFSDNSGLGALLISGQAMQNMVANVTIRKSVFSRNSSTSQAGAIDIAPAVFPATATKLNNYLATLPATQVSIVNDEFNQNNGALGGAVSAVLRKSDHLVLGADTFVGNVSTQAGGALAVSNGVTSMAHMLFKQNSASEGAAVDVLDFGEMAIANSLVVENVGGPSSRADSAAISGSHLSLSNVTLANNKLFALNVVLDSNTARAGASLKNLIISGNSHGCALGTGIALAGRNQQFPDDGTCTGVTRTTDPGLDSFYIPSPGNAALVWGDPSVCGSGLVGGVDIVYQFRGDADHCSLGAFERPPPQFFKRPNQDAIDALARTTNP